MHKKLQTYPNIEFEEECIFFGCLLCFGRLLIAKLCCGSSLKLRISFKISNLKLTHRQGGSCTDSLASWKSPFSGTHDHTESQA